MMVSKHRHALSSDSVRAGTAIAAWSKVKDLLPSQKIINVFNDKASRAPTRVTPETITVDDS